MAARNSNWKTNILLTASAVLLWAAPARAQAQEYSHAAWDRLLKKYVNEEGRVDYEAVRGQRADLDIYIRQIAERSPVSHPKEFSSRDSQLAYWINAYNALVIHAVVDEWPVKSVRDLGKLYGFFWRKKFTAGGRKYTLNGIEGEFLRKQLAEPRIHFAIVCAAVSCPRLQREAYTAENTERLLEEATRFYLNEPRNLKVEAGANRVTLPRILTWYKEDFEAYLKNKRAPTTGHVLVDYVKVYANEANRRALESLRKPHVDDFEYDWTINDVRTVVAREPAKGQKP